MYGNSESIVISVICLFVAVSQTTGLQCYECTDLVLSSSDEQLNEQYKNVNSKCSLTADNLKTCPISLDGFETKCFMSTTEVTATFQGKQVSVVIGDRRCSTVGNSQTDTCEDKTGLDGVTIPPTLAALGAKLDKSKIRRCFCSSDKCNNQEVSAPSGNSPLKPAIAISFMGLILSLALGNRA